MITSSPWLRNNKKRFRVLIDFGSVGTLDQVRARLAEIRTVQESTIIALTDSGTGSDYETRARYDTSDQLFENPFTQTVRRG